MKYLVTLQMTSPFVEDRTFIPWQQGSAYTAWIYRVLNTDNPIMADKIHRTPSVPQEKTSIRGFSISPLQFEFGHALSKGFYPGTPFAVLTIGTFDSQVGDALVRSASKVPLQVGDVVFSVVHVMTMPEPVWDATDSLSVQCSPIALRTHREGHAHPAFPRDPEWHDLLVQNLVHKARQFCGVTVPVSDVTITTAKDWQARYQRPYGFPVPAFRPRSELVITAPNAVYDAIYTLGLGVLNSAGLGVLTTDTATRLAGLDETEILVM